MSYTARARTLFWGALDRGSLQLFALFWPGTGVGKVAFGAGRRKAVGHDRPAGADRLADDDGRLLSGKRNHMIQLGRKLFVQVNGPAHTLSFGKAGRSDRI